MDVTAQSEIDRVMIELDGTPDKSRLGTNSIVGVSLAVLKAAANSTGLPLYRYIGGAGASTLPIPIVGIGTGGRYRGHGSSRWFKPSYEFAAYGAGACRVARSSGYNVHPCGSRDDADSIGDFAVGLNAGKGRAGNHNRLFAIEEDLGPSAPWPGKGRRQ